MDSLEEINNNTRKKIRGVFSSTGIIIIAIAVSALIYPGSKEDINLIILSLTFGAILIGTSLIVPVVEK